jgi:hypothetical protein
MPIQRKRRAWQRRHLPWQSRHRSREEKRLAKRQANLRYRQRKKSSLSSSPSNQKSDEPALILPSVSDEGAELAPRPVGRTEKQYQKLLDEYLGPLSGVCILLLCLFLYRFPLQTSEAIADALALNQDELDMIIPPLASLMEKQKWDEATRQRILQSGDIVGLSLGLGSYGARVLGALRELKGGGVHVSRQDAEQQTAQQSNGLFSPGFAQFAQFSPD